MAHSGLTSTPPWPTSALQRWFFRRLPADRGEVRLHRGRIYILPTRQGYTFAGVILLIVLGAMNYGASLGFFMAFMLVGLGLVSILHCFRNLHGLHLSVAPREPVFAGQQAHFTVRVHNPGQRDHYMLVLEMAQARGLVQALAAGAQCSVELAHHSERRGRLEPGALRVSTRYPLGLLRAWTWLKPSAYCIVYPAPSSDSLPLPVSPDADGTGHSRTLDNEDFFGFRDYRPGDPLRHIAWRTLARGQPLKTKEFVGESGGDLWLRWEDAGHHDTEQRLAQLCAWVLLADGEGLRYGLRLPGVEIAPGRGDKHRHTCLEALALY